MAKATSPRRSPWTRAARSWNSRTPSTRWSTSSPPSPTRSPASPARSAPRATWAGGHRCARVGHLEGPDRQRQLHGQQPHRPGPLHHAGRHRRGQGRPVAADHRRGQGRGRRAGDVINTMVDTLSAFATRSPASPARSAPRAASAARRTCERRRHLEGPHRQRQLHGQQPHRPGAQHRAGDDRGGRGDLSKKIDVDARGEILELKTTINTMVDQLSAFADEVTRVAREVGTEGRLGGQAEVEGSPAPGSASRRTSTSWPATSPARSARSPR